MCVCEGFRFGKAWCVVTWLGKVWFCKLSGRCVCIYIALVINCVIPGTYATYGSDTLSMVTGVVDVVKGTSNVT